MEKLPQDLEERLKTICDTYDLEDIKELRYDLNEHVERRMYQKQESYYYASHKVLDIMERYFRITKGDDY